MFAGQEFYQLDHLSKPRSRVHFFFLIYCIYQVIPGCSPFLTCTTVFHWVTGLSSLLSTHCLVNKLHQVPGFTVIRQSKGLGTGPGKVCFPEHRASREAACSSTVLLSSKDRVNCSVVPPKDAKPETAEVRRARAGRGQAPARRPMTPGGSEPRRAGCASHRRFQAPAAQVCLRDPALEPLFCGTLTNSPLNPSPISVPSFLALDGLSIITVS